MVAVYFHELKNILAFYTVVPPEGELKHLIKVLTSVYTNILS